MPRRAILVVDRRTVVDQAHLRAVKLATRLATASAGSVLASVAAALHRLRGDAPWGARKGARPLEVAHLRGAIPRDDGWANDPSQPMLGVSTVDQVGSRILFRGYGVSPGMRSIHAGLLGNDVVYFLDEVHLSRPFAQTLASVAQWRGTSDGQPPLHVVTMSATHVGTTSAAPFALDELDRANPVLRRRLGASKPATLEILKVSGDEHRRSTAFAQRLAELATAAVTDRHRRIAVVVNRVSTALATYDAVAAALGREAATLITGRMRPLDREDRERELVRVAAGVARGGVGVDPVTVVVATQCIEAGADLDFDVLITECASLDALVQRFGRLDRLGDHGDARGVVAIRSDHATEETDAVYGAARRATWEFLSRRPAPLDFGLAADVRADAPHDVFPDLVDAPLLLPAYLDLWSQTRPVPALEPDLALWLHGPSRARAEVNIIWRAGLPVAFDAAGALSEASQEALAATFEASPPLRLEVLTVPIWAANEWLRQMPVADLADVDGVVAVDLDDRRGPPALARWALRWLGGEDGVELLGPVGAALRPGDTIIVPTSYGGLRDGTWAPDDQTPVVDRGDEAQLRQRRRLVVRLDAVVASAPSEALAVAWWDPEHGDVPELATKLRAHLATSGPLWLKALCGDPRIRLGEVAFGTERVGEPSQLALMSPAPVRAISSSNEGGYAALLDVSSDDDRASRTGVAVPLAAHLAHVRDQADAFARARGVPLGVATDVVLAAAWHDVGKVDPRFQLWLAGGDEVAMLDGPLAKSKLTDDGRRQQQLARRRAGYPTGARHELASVAMLERAPDVLAQAHDADLFLHLVASHHGWCRPYAPVEQAGAPVQMEWSHDGVTLGASSEHGLAAVGASVVERFWRVTARYGWWGLAWLETLVRLADHRASEAEQEQRIEGGTP